MGIFSSMKTNRMAIYLLLFIPVLAWSTGEYEGRPLPTDAKIAVEELDNGLTYYIRENAEPRNRAHLRLVVNAGSILEDPSQLGLAHMAEHMAFNGTEKYKESEIVDYLESIGMRFGPEINAYTSFDETVYMLQVPTDEPDKLERGFDILSQWAFSVSFDHEEIDKERNVIVEEWRTGLGAQDRLQKKQYPVLFNASRYAERLPIGDISIIETFEYDEIKRFYREWYRPEHMAVIAVGDFDSSRIEKLISKYFAHVPAASVDRPRKFYTVPDHDRTLYAVASDPEQPYTQVAIYNKGEASALDTYEDYRKLLVHQLYSRMINARFSEAARSPDAPFLAAGSGRTNLVRSKGVNYLFAVAEGNQVGQALEAIIVEARRALEYGFTSGELDRAKRESLRRIERAYAERDNAKSESFMQEYTRHFLTGEATPGIEHEYELYRQYIPEIELSDVNAVAKSYLQDRNRVIVVSAVEKQGLARVGEADLRVALERAEQMTVHRYVDSTAEAPLISELPAPGGVIDRTYHDVVDVTEWVLSNGARVFLKPTDFKNDEIRFHAFSPGGTSLYDRSDFFSATYTTALVDESGIGGLSAVDLTKSLTGKTVSVSPYVDTIEEGLRGMSSTGDIETLFQLVYAYFTAPREDRQAFDTLIRTLETLVQNRESQPSRVLSDRLGEIMSTGHYTSRPLSGETIQEIDFERAMEIFSERFADASDYTFAFVGNIEPDDLEPYLEAYVAALPSSGRTELWRDRGIERPVGTVVETIRAGVEPQSQVVIVFHGDYEWSRQNNHLLLSLADTLRIRLREVLREEESGTYGVGVGARFSRYPKERYSVQIFFGTGPERAEELARLAMEVVDEVKMGLHEEIYLTKVKETQREGFELDIRENRYWLSSLKNAVVHGRELSTILTYPDMIADLEAEEIAEAARMYLDTGRYVRVILYPKETVE